MTTKTEHTPGPWKVGKDESIWTTANHHETICRMSIGEMGMGPYLADRPTGTYGSIVDPAEREANADFIARACNCHDDLVRALRDILDAGQYNADGDFVLAHERWDGISNPPDYQDAPCLVAARDIIEQAVQP